MSYELLISMRYLKAKRKHVFISVISFISVGGVALGVAALIITLSIMNGFQIDIKKKIVGNSSDIVVLDQRNTGIENVNELRGKIETDGSVIATAPFVFTQVMLKYRDSSSGATLKGIEPGLTEKVLDVHRNMKEGDLGGLAQEPESFPGIVLGCELAKNLGVSMGRTVLVMSPSASATHLGFIPKIKRFKVIGIFDSGMYEYNNNLGYVSLGVAQELLGMGDCVSGIEVRVKDMFRAKQDASRIQDNLGFPYWVRSWIDTNWNLFSALKLEKFILAIILVLIILVAMFNILSTLIMMTLEKTRDIGILKAIGSRNFDIMKIFVFQGGIIGFFGTVIGAAAGWTVCRLLDRYEFIKLPADVYYLNTIPVIMQAGDIIAVCLGAMAISLIATIYPARQASKLDPCEAISHY